MGLRERSLGAVLQIHLHDTFIPPAIQLGCLLENLSVKGRESHLFISRKEKEGWPAILLSLRRKRRKTFENASADVSAGCYQPQSCSFKAIQRWSSSQSYADLSCSDSNFPPKLFLAGYTAFAFKLNGLRHCELGFEGLQPNYFITPPKLLFSRFLSTIESHRRSSKVVI